VKKRLIKYVKTHYQFLINVYLFINFFGYTMYQLYMVIKTGHASFVEISFIVQNVILSFVVIIRIPHKTIDHSVFHQIIALVAFFSGAAFMGQPSTSDSTLVAVSTVVTAAANVIGIITLLNLGKSFGILIALRKVKRHGAYGLIRHPMYFSDILLRCGFLVSHFNVFVVIMFVVSTACYVYRAILEERHLSERKEYRAYMTRVRYRFIPFIF